MQPDVKEIFNNLRLEYNKHNCYPYVEILSKVQKYGFSLPEDIDPVKTDSKIMDKYFKSREFASAFLKYIKTEYKHLHEYEEKYMNLTNSIMWDKPMLKNMVDFVLHKMSRADVRDFL